MKARPDPDPPLRKTVTLPRGMWSAIADFRFTERIGTETEAVRRLLLAALRALPKRTKR